MSALPKGFHDFDVLIEAEESAGVYPIKVIESPTGEAKGELVLPIAGEELEAALERMRALDTDESVLADFGTQFFSALFSGNVGRCYAESVGRAGEGKGLRIRLHIVPPELAVLPWELLYDPEKGEFLGLSKRTLITRYPDVPRPPAPLSTELPLRLLIATASPRDLPQVVGEAEVAKIKTTLTPLVEDNLILCEVLHNTTSRALREKLMEPYHILHFIGHGGFYEGAGSLAFENRYGETDLVSGRTLATLLKNSSVRLVVLNACQSAQDLRSGQAFTGVGPALMKAGIPAVIAMQFVIADDSALAFAQDFYGMLSRYLPVDECVSRAREGLMLDIGVENVDWATPVLFLRAPDGVIFISKVIDQAEDEDLEKKKRGYFGDLSTARREPAQAAAGLPQEKEIVNHLWAMADCPAYRRWEDPDETISNCVARYEDGYWEEATRQEVTAVVDQQPMTIILGDTGMGKTAILERLAFLYAQNALRSDPDDPSNLIPVFVKLSQYSGEDSLVPLIRIGLNRHGQIKLSPEKDDLQTRTLLAKRHFIILIDAPYQIPGDEKQRARGTAAVCRCLDEYPQHKYVITCRSSTYDEQFHERGGEWIVLPHSDQEVEGHFVRRLGETRGRELYSNLPARMRELARIPLLLSMLLDELQDRGPKAAMQQGTLFANFMSRMLSEGKTALSVENKKTLLARLAFTMKLDQTQEYSQVSALEVIGREARNEGLEKVIPRDILDDLIDSGLLRTGSTAHIAFSHPWFQDYFAALVVQDQFEKGKVKWEVLTKGYWWHEVIFFLVSMVQQPGTLIEQLLAHDPLLAAECSLEGETVNETLQGQIVAALAELEELGTEKEKGRATELLTEFHAAGMVQDIAPYRQAVDARIDDSGERPTSIALFVRGHLLVTRGPLAGTRFPLLDGTVYLGRSRYVNITLRHRSVSRRHAEIRVEGQKFNIRDLGSTNGTQVNGRQITTWRQLQDGDEIELGDLPLTLSVQKR